MLVAGINQWGQHPLFEARRRADFIIACKLILFDVQDENEFYFEEGINVIDLVTLAKSICILSSKYMHSRKSQQI